ncbi:uncharacterized protein V6R79_017288 [Siganus canaliculatus]
MPRRFRREKYVLTLGVRHLRGDYTFALPWPELQLVVTNLRNRPLPAPAVRSLRACVLSLYHNLVTGSRDFPLIPYDGYFLFRQTVQPFGSLEMMENSPSGHVWGPPGLAVPTTGSRSAGPTVLVPVHPERTELAALLDRRNCIRRVLICGRAVRRVISPVYRSDHSELVNLWRVSDYTVEGCLLMSVFCRFTSDSMEFVETRTQNGKKRALEGGSSSEAPPRKCFRL